MQDKYCTQLSEVKSSGVEGDFFELAGVHYGFYEWGGGEPLSGVEENL